MANVTPREVKTILVATDLSMESVGAVTAATWLAGRLKAALHAAFVYEGVRERAEKAVPGLSGAQKKFALEEFGKFASTPTLSAATHHVRGGSPAREVLKVAKEVGADLVVVGRYGQSGLKRGRLGSIAERIVRESLVSVLVVPGGFGGEFRRVGVATDFDEGSDLALRRAGALCRVVGSKELGVLHAFAVPAGHHMIASWEDTCRRLKAVSDQLAAEQSQRVLGPGAGGLALRFRSEEGAEAEVVTRLASEEKLDVLVMGAQSRTRAAAALLGHTSEKVIQGAECAVWAEKAPDLAQGFLEAMKELLK